MNPGDYRYPVPTASVFSGVAQYVPLLLTAVDMSLDRPDVWEDSDADTAMGYMEDLKAWIQELTDFMFVPIGAVLPLATASTPSGWLLCDGTQYNRVDYPDLYAALHSAFIVNADVFSTPNLAGRMVVAPSGSTYLMGASGGESKHTLTVNELPQHGHSYDLLQHSHTIPDHTHTQNAHTHTVTRLTNTSLGASSGLAAGTNGVGGVGTSTSSSETPTINNKTGLSTNNSAAQSSTTGLIGDGDAHNNMPPFLVLKYIIRAK